MKRIIALLIICLSCLSAYSWWLSADSVKSKIKMKLESHAVSKLLFARPTDSLLDTSNIYYDVSTQKTMFPNHIYFDPAASGGIYNEDISNSFFIALGTTTGPDRDSGAYLVLQGNSIGGKAVLAAGKDEDIVLFGDDILVYGSSGALARISASVGATLGPYIAFWDTASDNYGNFNLFAQNDGDSAVGIIQGDTLEIRGSDRLEFQTGVGYNNRVIIGEDGHVYFYVVNNANTDPDKFLVHDGSDMIDYRTGTEMLSDLSGDAGAAFNWNSQNLTGIGTFQATDFEVESDGGVFAYNLATGVGGETDLVINGSDEILLKSSSIKFKKDIKPHTVNSLKIQEIKVYDFKWKKNNKDDFGFIAEDLAKIYPGIETYNNNREIQSWDTQKMIVLAVMEIQRLHKEVEALRKKINEHYYKSIIEVKCTN